MKIFDKLKAIGIHLPKLEKLCLIKFSLNIDRSIKAEGGSTIIINPSKLGGKQRRKLEKIISSEVLDEAGAIVEESNSPLLEEAVEALPAIRQSSQKFAAIIPPSDLPLLHACLFLRRRFERGECVEDLKGQIMRVYGTRGGNFANLCSAGYLEEWFAPLYDGLLNAHPNDPTAARSKFLVYYNTILNELPWTEFVSARASTKKVCEHIVQKLQRNVKNGVRHLNIHGLGVANVKKIVSILPEIQIATGAIPVRTEQEAQRIFVRLEIPPQ